ncbi:unnamed protein product [Diatraea saccharalis]|uniref:Uncharacterized protein n=1 Tax=Diatraea saccharalis TaxID=40085 RepID=A0A9N9R2U1_9NEOP|nr:unnamed protein product [Diatraea saccharalis]
MNVGIKSNLNGADVKQRRHKPIRICDSKECLRSAANLALSIDRTVHPCDDFYKYVCGNWPENHPRPDAEHSYDWFREKQIRVYTTLREFLSKYSYSRSKPVQQAKDVYKACMDIETLDKLGLKPVFKILKDLNLPPYPTYINITEDFDYDSYSFDWIETVIKLKTYLGMDVLIGFDIFTAPKNSSVYRLVIGSPETTNPFPSMHIYERKRDNRKTRNFKISTYNDVDETLIVTHTHNFAKKQDVDNDDERTSLAYKLFYAELMKIFVIETGNFTSSNIDEPKLDQKILTTSKEYYSLDNNLDELESDNGTETDDDEAYLNIPEYTVDEIQAHTDEIVNENNGTAVPIWRRYLDGIFKMSDTTLDFENDKILVSQADMKYLAAMATLVSKTPPVLIELYIWVKVVEVLAAHTTTEIRQLIQRSHDEINSNGPSVPQPRSLQCASAVNEMMGMAVSYAIADPNFFNVTKPKVETMLYEMKNALAHLVGKAKWMDDNTKLATYQKIIEMKTLIGFPDWFMENGRLEEYYKGIQVNRDTHIDNMISIIQFKLRKAFNKLRAGRQFDKNGNYRPWWTNETVQSFVNMTECFIDQYSSFYVRELRKYQLQTMLEKLAVQQPRLVNRSTPLLLHDNARPHTAQQTATKLEELQLECLRHPPYSPDLAPTDYHFFEQQITIFFEILITFCKEKYYVDGKKTLGENIADNGGVKEAFAALQHHLRKHGPEPKLPGFEDMTSEQMFFISYANLWCEVPTIDALEYEIDDEHSPHQFRPKGSLQNNEEFARAWHCPPGSKMNPITKCIIF